MANKWKELDTITKRLVSRGVEVSTGDVEALRRIEKTLHRWGELECGDGNAHASWCITRDETTGKPYMEVHPHNGKERRHPVADRERGALKRLAALCKRLGLHFYYQTDPRGCALYVAAVPLTAENYNSNGAACCG